MRKEFRVVDENKNIVQITSADERWYVFQGKNKKTGLPELRFLPSVTWICEYYPKGIAFYKWLANKGWDEAEAIKTAAGDKGSKVHYAIGDLLKGKKVDIGACYVNPTTEKTEELTVEEYECVLSFARWYEEIKPEIIESEILIINKKEEYAGMIDLVCIIDNFLYIVDFKSGQYIWPSHELQLSAYKHANTKFQIKLNDCKLAILQLGYRRNKKHYKFTETDDKYEQFLAAKTIWFNETKGIEPSQKDLPLSISISIPKLEKNKKENKNAERERPKTK